MQQQWQRYLAELLGTFVLVFAGTTAIVGADRSGIPPLIVAPFAFGLALLAGLYAFAEVSGGHFNPAVSIGLFLDRRVDASDLVGYLVMQFVGATLASLVLLVVTSKHEVALTATTPAAGNASAFVIELVFTAIFVTVILQSSKSERFGGSALIAIPLTLLAIHFAAIPFSGSSVNPARTFGPALVGDVWKGFWIYMIAPPLGAVIAWVVHTVVVKGDLNLGGSLSSGDGEATDAA
jgi:aquaporin Z